MNGNCAFPVLFAVTSYDPMIKSTIEEIKSWNEISSQSDIY